MKKTSLIVFMVLGLILATALMTDADELRTKLDAYRPIHQTSGSTVETSPATTDFNVGSSDQDAAFDLMAVDISGSQTTANSLTVIVSATTTDDKVCTIEYWGISEGGPLEKICSVAYIFGTAVRSTGVLWADTATITDNHISTVRKGGGVSNDVIRVTFDMTGFRFIRPYVTAVTDTTNVTIEGRFY